MLELQLAAIAVATLSLYSYRADFGRYSIFTVGVFKRLDRAVVEGADYECAEHHCEAETDISEQRTYYREIVVAGMPLLRYDKGQSHYCEDHVSFEVHDELDNPKRSKTERPGTSLVVALGSFLEGKADLEPSQDHDSPFDDVVTSTHSALSLMPVVLLVLLAAVIIEMMNRVSPQ